jgi:hypothetical protein
MCSCYFETVGGLCDLQLCELTGFVRFLEEQCLRHNYQLMLWYGFRRMMALPVMAVC